MIQTVVHGRDFRLLHCLQKIDLLCSRSTNGLDYPRWLEWRSLTARDDHIRDMKCSVYDPDIMGSNPRWVELGVHRDLLSSLCTDI